MRYFSIVVEDCFFLTQIQTRDPHQIVVMWEGRNEERLIVVDLIDRNADLIGHLRRLLQAVVVAV